MFNHKAILLLFPILGLSSATKEREFFKNLVTTSQSNLARRQTAPPPGYHPEFGACGSGTTCEDACGPNWLSCSASTDLSLFCYNQVDFGQTCCENGSGRACDRGYYCAWQTFGGRVWCCEDGQSLEECGVPGGVTTRSSTSTTSTTTRSSTTSTNTTTTGSGCHATATFWATTTLYATVEVTKTVGGCSSVTDTSLTSGTTPTDTTITGPPTSSTTLPPTNTTTTRTIVTAGAAGLKLNGLALGLAAMPLLW